MAVNREEIINSPGYKKEFDLIASRYQEAWKEAEERYKDHPKYGGLFSIPEMIQEQKDALEVFKQKWKKLNEKYGIEDRG